MSEYPKILEQVVMLVRHARELGHLSKSADRDAIDLYGAIQRVQPDPRQVASQLAVAVVVLARSGVNVVEVGSDTAPFWSEET